MPDVMEILAFDNSAAESKAQRRQMEQDLKVKFCLERKRNAGDIDRGGECLRESDVETSTESVGTMSFSPFCALTNILFLFSTSIRRRPCAGTCVWWTTRGVRRPQGSARPPSPASGCGPVKVRRLVRGRNRAPYPRQACRSHQPPLIILILLDQPRAHDGEQAAVRRILQDPCAAQRLDGALFGDGHGRPL